MDKKTIKDLLAGRLTKSQRKSVVEWIPIDKEIRKEWDECVKKEANPEIKEQIWEKVKIKCNLEKKNQVLVELRWIYIAASFALLLAIGGLWKTSKVPPTHDEYINIVATQSQVYTLPDSSKVWMEAGSSIRYAKAFNQNRKVWLSGNSLFEVVSQNGLPFQVYIPKAMIEVKGTCFDIRQDPTDKKNEIVLYNGKVSFIPENNKEIKMMPHQKITHNVENGEILQENIKNIEWENGRFYFKELPLPQLIETINNMYFSDIRLEVNNQEIKSAFTGYIRYEESLEEVIQKICYSLSLHVQKRENQLIISK